MGRPFKGYAEFKHCGRCKLDKKLSDFREVQGGKFLSWLCKPCSTEYNKQWLKDHRKKLWYAAKARSVSKKIDFNITMEDITIPEYCPVFKIKLEQSNTKQADNSPSLDRIDNSKGYEKGNIRVISWKANRAKGDSTLEELKQLINYMENI